MRYERILSYVASSLWAILPEKMTEILSVLAFRAAGGAFTAEQIQARIGDPQRSAPSTRGAVAVIPLHGMIAHRIGSMDEASGGISVERFMAMYRQATADETVGSIVLDVNSPGGTVQGVQEAAAELLAMRAAQGRKYTVAVANATMASAAYWLAAAAADEIVAMPSAAVGSIGIFAVREDLSEHLKQNGIKVDVIKAGKYKAEDLPFAPMSDEARAHIAGRVDETYAVMTKQIAQGRGVTPLEVRNGYGEGRALGAKDAKAAGLVDRIATFDETLARLASGRRSSAGLRAEGVSAETLQAMEEFSAVNPELAAQLIEEEAARRRRLERF